MRANKRFSTVLPTAWCLVLAAVLLAITTTSVHATPASVTPASTYPAERDRLRAEILRLGREGTQSQTLDAMDSLRRLAQANGDHDLAQLMALEHIFATHDDASIDESLDAVNAVRAQVRPRASVELQEALSRIYGNLYFDAGNFQLALQHQLEALRLSDRLPEGAEQARLYRLGTIAELYNAMGLPKEALRYADQGLANSTTPGASLGNRVALLGTRALALLQLGRTNEATEALDAAATLDAGKQPGFNTMRLAANQATLQLATAGPGTSIATIERLRALAESQNSRYYRTRAQLLHGQARIAQGDIDGGLQEMRAAISSFEQLGHMIDVLDGREREIRALRSQGAWRQAVEEMQEQRDLWSRLFRNAQSRTIAELEARHRAERREQRITALANEVRLERTRLHFERLLLALAVALALLATLAAALLYRSRHRARRERDRLSHAARHDPLTGVFSRYELQRRLFAAEAGASHVIDRAVLLLDLDDFKAINDRHGHEAGDAALKAVVARLHQHIHAGDEIFRWGGEEFLLMLAERDQATLEQDAFALLEVVAHAPVNWHGQAIPVTLSGGLIRHPQAPDWDTPLGDAIRWADAALYAAKRAGRNRIIQVHLTALGIAELASRRPIDTAQLQDWERKGYVRLQSLQPNA